MSSSLPEFSITHTHTLTTAPETQFICECTDTEAQMKKGGFVSLEGKSAESPLRLCHYTTPLHIPPHTHTHSQSSLGPTKIHMVCLQFKKTPFSSLNTAMLSHAPVSGTDSPGGLFPWRFQLHETYFIVTYFHIILSALLLLLLLLH